MPPARLLAALALIPLAACADADGPAVAEAPGASAPGASAPAPDVLSPDTLRALFPDSVSGFPRTAASGRTEGALGVEVARAAATYAEDASGAGPTVEVRVVDLGSPSMVERSGYGWGLRGNTPDTVFAGLPAEVEPLTPGGRTAVRVVVGERFLVEAEGQGAPLRTTEEAVRRLASGRLADLAAAR